MKKVSKSLLDYRADDDCYYFEGSPFTGVAVTLFKDGRERCIEPYEQGLRSGGVKEWYESGQLMVDSVFRRGVLHGHSKAWHKNGQLAESGEYEYGIALWEKSWGEDGGAIEDYRLTESDPDFENLKRHRDLYRDP